MIGGNVINNLFFVQWDNFLKKKNGEEDEFFLMKEKKTNWVLKEANGAQACWELIMILLNCAMLIWAVKL